MRAQAGAFGLATIVVAALAQRGDAAARWCGRLILIVWLGYVATRFGVSLDASAKVRAALDVFAAVACTLVWVVTGRCWPLVLMALFMLQNTAHFAYVAKDAEMAGHGATPMQRWSAATHPMETLLDATNVLQLLTVLAGPHVREWGRILRRRLGAGRRRDRGAVFVRETSP